jgi:hypothetical protein
MQEDSSTCSFLTSFLGEGSGSFLSSPKWNVARISDTHQQIFVQLHNFLIVPPKNSPQYLSAITYMSEIFNALAQYGRAKPTNGETTGK